MATCLGCSGSSGIWNSGCPQDATNKLLELRKPMKGQLTEVDSGGGEGRLEGGAHHPGSGWGTTQGYRPKIRTLRGEKPQAQAPPGEAVPCGPCRKPTAPAAGPGRRLLPCSPAFLLRTSLQNHAPNFLFSAKQRSSPCAPRSAAVLPQLAGPGWQFSATPEETHFGW